MGGGMRKRPYAAHYVHVKKNLRRPKSIWSLHYCVPDKHILTLTRETLEFIIYVSGK